MARLRGAVITLNLAGLLAAQAEPTATPTAERYARHVAPHVERYCTKCHSGGEPEADLDLAPLRTLATAQTVPKVLQLAAAMLTSGDMPPADADQPTLAERDQLRDGLRSVLAELARAHAGDPGVVRLRRLDNAAFTYAVRDLTGLAELEPALEFPVDSAAGEGFTNVGQALVMSPMLLDKYLSAAKAIAAHAVLTPDGLRFSPSTTRRDQTEELVAAIRAHYRRYAVDATGETVDLQGVVFTTNGDGRLPLARYLAAALAVRDGAALDGIATERHLSAKYLRHLLAALTDGAPSPLLDHVRTTWRNTTGATLPKLLAEIQGWQRELFTFRSVGHIGKLGGPRAWQEPIAPWRAELDLRCKLPSGSEPPQVHIAVTPVCGAVPVSLRKPRLVAVGRPDLALRDLPAITHALTARRVALHTHAAGLLAAAREAQVAPKTPRDTLAARHQVPCDLLETWLAALGDRPAEPLDLLRDRQTAVANNPTVTAWSRGELPSVVANAGATTLRIPGTLAPHSLAVHPTPQDRVLIVWRSHATSRLVIRAEVQHVHTACGNGVSFGLELRRGGVRVQLAHGLAVDERTITVAAPECEVAAGDQVALWVSARDHDHTCDLTRVELRIASGAQTWHLSDEVATNLLAGNPHADGIGHGDTWSFAAEPHRATEQVLAFDNPWAQSLFAPDPDARELGAETVARWLSTTPPELPAAAHPLLALDGPLFADCLAATCNAKDEDELRLTANTTLTIPAELAAGRELLATATLASPEGAAQVSCSTTSDTPDLAPGPLLVHEGSQAHAELIASADSFRALFPIALCYSKIVPVDEVITLTLFHREDEPLVRLMLTPDEAAELDRLWAELRFVSRDALDLVDVFEQLYQYATQDADPSAFEPLRAPIAQRAAAFREQQRAAEPHQLAAVLAFAARAFRREVADHELATLRSLYAQLRADGVDHDGSIQTLLVRVLVAPQFLYRVEQPGPGADAVPVTPHELAARLSFALLVSIPDAPLRAAADDGSLRNPDVLLAHARRLLVGPHARRFAFEFGATWLHLRDFAQSTDKSERHFPGFDTLRCDLLEEVVLTFIDLVQRDLSVLTLLDADHTFLNERLATHYGLAGIAGAQFRRVDGVRAHGRGGILGLGAVLASQAGASRTSPILRGNFVSEVLLGERLPRPPKDVPRLPEDEAEQDLTVRQLVERHRADQRCAQCHDRIDPLGFALEGFDAIGRRRSTDLAGRTLDTHTRTRDGQALDGAMGLRTYLATTRRSQFLRQFSRKLLGYLLGRSVQLSDEPLLDTIAAQWPAHDYRFSFALEQILRSPQFRNVRGREARED